MAGVAGPGQRPTGAVVLADVRVDEAEVVRGGQKSDSQATAIEKRRSGSLRPRSEKRVLTISLLPV